MKNSIISLLITVAVSQVSFSQNWTLVWQDEFTNRISEDWVFETGNGNSGWGNNELQYYRQQNATIENGNLVITAKQENVGGYNYTSARMKTQGRKSWKYGKVEARISMPSFMGSWPAFWMLGDNISSVGWPACGEIDIMEHVNTETQTHGTIHWQDHTTAYANYSGSTPVSSVTDFHVYTIEWDASAIKWFVDGNLYHQASIANGVNGTSEFHDSFFILLNMAIGGNWPGFNINTNAFPARMLVDYVRVYQQTASPSGPVTLFQHCNYEGYAVSLGEGKYTMSQLQALGFVDNDISSVVIGEGYQITMYEHDNFTGASLVKTATDDCLVNEGFNDIMSSAVISKTSFPSWSTLIEAEDSTAQSGTQTESCSEGGLNVGWIDTHDWMVWDVDIPNSGSYLIEYRVASPNADSRLQLENAGGNPVYGTIVIPDTGGWQNWTTIQQTVNLDAGLQQIAVKALTGGWNINWLKLTSIDSKVSRVITNTFASDPLLLFPNPTSDFLKISGSKTPGPYLILNTTGQIVLQGDLNTKIIHVNMLNNGVYFFKDLQTGIIKKFIKE